MTRLSRLIIFLILTLSSFSVFYGCGGGSKESIGGQTEGSKTAVTDRAVNFSGLWGTGTLPAEPDLLGGVEKLGVTECANCHAVSGSPIQVMRAKKAFNAAEESWLLGPHGNYESWNASEFRTEDRGADNTGFPFYGYEGLGTDPKCTTACHDPLNEGRTLSAAYARTGKYAVGRLDRPVVGCEACHGGGSDHFGVGSLPIPRPNALRCGRCHNSVFADQKDHLKYHPEGSSIAEDYSSSPHAKAIDPKAFVPGSSTDVTAECSRCHTDEGAKTYLPAVNGTESYEQVKANMAGKSNMSNASVVQCRTCHDKHNPDTLIGKKAVGLPAGWSDEFRTCNACHQLLSTDGMKNAAGYHDPAVNATGAVDAIIADTHYDDPATDVIEGYVVNPASTHSGSGKNTNSGTCRDCHNPHNADNTINRQWAKAAHGGFIIDEDGVSSPVSKEKAPAWTYYDFKVISSDPTLDRKACQRCHTATGFRNFANDPAGYDPAKNSFIAKGKQKELLYCWACHTSNTGNLRNPGPFTAPYNFQGAPAKFPDIETSNVCVPCHSGRESGESLTSITDFTNAGFRNSHYRSAAGLMYVKSGFIAFVDPNTPIGSSTYGKSLTSTDDGGALSSTHRKLGTPAINGDSHNPSVFTPGNYDSGGPCVTCHMNATGQPDRGTSHTWAINANAFNQLCVNCHESEGGITLTAENFESVFLRPQEEIFQDALELAEEVLLKNFNIMYDAHTYPYFYDLTVDPSGKTAVRDWTRGGTVDGMKLMGACFNINLLKRDPGTFAHARTYTRRLIYDTIDFLDDKIINLSSGTTALATSPAVYGKGASAYTDGTLTALAPGTTEAMTYLIGWSRSTGKWNPIERP